MSSFYEIYILDLHGNSLKKEKCPDGSKDENVFDIQQGVAVALFIKKKGQKKECKVYHSEIWGLREKKYDWLLESELETASWVKLNPTSPYYFFVPREEKGREIYEKYWKVTDVFPLNVTGVVTARDHFVIDFDRKVLKRRIEMFTNLSMSDGIIKQTFKLEDTRGWRYTEARRALAKDKNWDTYFTKVLYRPFDIREIYYTQRMVDWPRPEVMPHMLQGNLGLSFTRPQSPKYEFSVLASENIIDQCVVGNKSAGAGISYIAPLHLYPDPDKKDLFSHVEKLAEKKPNLDPSILRVLSEAYGHKPTPEEIFHYVYGVLYSPIYRAKYAEFLKTDFPRAPFTRDRELFTKVANLGKRLVDLHLLKSAELDPPIARFQGAGDNKVEKRLLSEKEKRVYVNKAQYFEGVGPEVWQYQIGGYQVLDKWLKDRKGRVLSMEDIRHYCRVVTALSKTIQIQTEIDRLYPEIEKTPLTLGDRT
ncbi:MAG: type ISP restriction/modification enzyme [Candidatus Binatia bacterium]